MQDYGEAFQNPPRRYAIFPIIHERVAVPEGAGAAESAALEQIDSLGYAGIVGNVPYGRGFPDDGDEWKRTADGFRGFINRGMTAWIYDEKGYPSGTARGAIFDGHPEYIVEGVLCYQWWMSLKGPDYRRFDLIDGSLYKAFLLPADGGEPLDITGSQDGQGVMRVQVPEGEYKFCALVTRRMFDGTHTSSSWSEPRNYMFIGDADATRAFVEATHENYKRVLGDEFGKGVMAFFTDEPAFMTWHYPSCFYVTLPWHRSMPGLFLQKYGYPIERALLAVMLGRGFDVAKLRCDYWEFVGDMTAENFFGTIQKWCGANELKSSGHLMDEEHLQQHVINYGSLFRVGRKMDWPGIDYLYGTPTVMTDTSLIPVARLMASFADISGETETFTEFSDTFSHHKDNVQIDMNWIRASVNWHAAQGINNFTSYFNFDAFTDEQIRDLNAYVARIGLLIREGVRDSRVALFYPDAAIWAAYNPNTNPHAWDDGEQTLRVNDAFAKTSWELLHRQIDFDYIDESILIDGEIKNGKLLYNKRSYECLVLPAANVISDAAANKVKLLLDSGAGVIFVGDLPEISRDTGLKADFAEMFAAYRKCDNYAFVPIRKGWSLPPFRSMPLPRPYGVCPAGVNALADGSDLVSSGIMSHCRVLPDGSNILFMCNMGDRVYKGSLWHACAASAKRADPKTGGIIPLKASLAGGRLTVDVEMKPYEAFFYLLC